MPRCMLLRIGHRRSFISRRELRSAAATGCLCCCRRCNCILQCDCHCSSSRGGCSCSGYSRIRRRVLGVMQVLQLLSGQQRVKLRGRSGRLLKSHITLSSAFLAS